MDNIKEYLKNVFGDLFNYFLLPYISGYGEIKNLKNEWVKVEWSLSIHINGQHFFYIKADKPLISNSDIDRNVMYPELVMKGQTEDGFIFFCDSIVIDKINGFIGVNNFVLHEATLRKDAVIYKDVTYKELKGIKYVKNSVLNYKIEEPATHIEYNKRKYSFALNQFFAKYKEYLKYGIIDTCCLSYYVIETKSGDNFDKIIEDCLGFEELLSLTQLNSTISPVRYFLNENKELECIYFRNIITFKYKNVSIIDNNTGGLQRFFIAVENIFLKFRNEKLYKIIQYLQKITDESFLDAKWVLLLIALEYFTLYYLENFTDLSDDKIKSIENIQQKLNVCNRYMEFIPSELLKDELRDGFRNPFFHTGDLPSMDINELYSAFLKYFDLLVRMVVRTLGYSGKFISMSNECKPINV